MAPKSIFVQTEDGLGEIACDKFPLAKTFGEVMQALSDLYTEEHTYRTVVVDSLDWLERLIWEEVCKQKTVESIEDIGYAKGYTFALTQWREFLTGLEALRADRGMMIILIAHAKIEKFENPETENYDRYVPRIHKLASHIVQEWCDEVLFATYRVHVKQTKEGLRQEGHQGRRHRRAHHPHDRAPGARGEEPPEPPRRTPPGLERLRAVPGGGARAEEVASRFPVPFHSQGEDRGRPERIQCERS